MEKCIKKDDIYDFFEYGNENFPSWFNILVTSGAVKISDKVFPELENKGRSYAGIIAGQDFYFGDVFVKKNNEIVEVYSPEEFSKEFIIIPKALREEL